MLNENAHDRRIVSGGVAREGRKQQLLLLPEVGAPLAGEEVEEGAARVSGGLGGRPLELEGDVQTRVVLMGEWRQRLTALHVLAVPGHASAGARIRTSPQSGCAIPPMSPRRAAPTLRMT